MNEQEFYDSVAVEIQQGQLSPGLWTKAFADAAGDQTMARVIYIRERVSQLRREAHTRNEDIRRAERERQAIEFVRREAESAPRRMYITIGFVLLTCALLALIMVLAK